MLGIFSCTFGHMHVFFGELPTQPSARSSWIHLSSWPWGKRPCATEPACLLPACASPCSGPWPHHTHPPQSLPSKRPFFCLESSSPLSSFVLGLNATSSRWAFYTSLTYALLPTLCPPHPIISCSRVSFVAFVNSTHYAFLGFLLFIFGPRDQGSPTLALVTFGAE